MLSRQLEDHTERKNRRNKLTKNLTLQDIKSNQFSETFSRAVVAAPKPFTQYISRFSSLNVEFTTAIAVSTLFSTTLKQTSRLHKYLQNYLVVASVPNKKSFFFSNQDATAVQK